MVKFAFVFEFILLYQQVRLLGLESPVEYDKIAHTPSSINSRHWRLTRKSTQYMLGSSQQHWMLITRHECDGRCS